MTQPNASPDWEGDPLESGRPGGRPVRWWVVLTNAARATGRRKFYSGHADERAALDLAAFRNGAEEAERARTGAAAPRFVYSVIPRPDAPPDQPGDV